MTEKVVQALLHSEHVLKQGHHFLLKEKHMLPVVHTLQNSSAWILSPFYYFECDTSNQKVVSEQIFLTLLPH